MKCPICDREDDLISFNKTTGQFGDCTVCQAIIEETLEEFETESEPAVDHTEGGRGDRLYRSGVEPGGTARRPFCETYNVSTES